MRTLNEIDKELKKFSHMRVEDMQQASYRKQINELLDERLKIMEEAKKQQTKALTTTSGTVAQLG